MDKSEQVPEKGGKGGKAGVRRPPANPMNLWMVDRSRCPDGWWPELRPTQAVPKRMVTFMVADSAKQADAFCHFYIDDYRFERLWSDPRGYLPILRRYAGLIAPDFSTYTDMPKPLQAWNVYRSRALAAYWQANGIEVIPTIQFGQEDTWEWAFDGMPRHSVLAASVVGCYREAEARSLLVRGMERVARELEPTALVMYGKEIPFDAGAARVLWYPNDNDQRMTRWRTQARQP